MRGEVAQREGLVVRLPGEVLVGQPLEDGARRRHLVVELGKEGSAQHGMLLLGIGSAQGARVKFHVPESVVNSSSTSGSGVKIVRTRGTARSSTEAAGPWPDTDHS